MLLYLSKVPDCVESAHESDAENLCSDENVQRMLPLVKHVAGRIALLLPPHITREELISAGVLGLLDALHKYDVHKGSNLRSYCILRIRGAILDELRRLDWVPRSVHRDARRIAAAQHAVAQKLGREPHDFEVAEEMGLSINDLQAMLDRVRPTSFLSLSDPVFGCDESDSLVQEEILADTTSPDAFQEMLRMEEREILLGQLRQLPEVQRQVLMLYYLEDMRLREIAEVLHLTESRISQIHTLAINRLRTALSRERSR
ncbi:FliA/WhiG family RNA polymerase sigma factor [Verrucomicrobia bacterium LW23]|nr:FliA/WhiG family RNA polymerase sigma factor [Verrucomicrobia bacterium LW23]